MSLSNVYGKADDEESKAMLRHAIDIGCVSTSYAAKVLVFKLLSDFLGHVYTSIFAKRELILTFVSRADIYGAGHK